jgi:hypothetical protein
MSEKLYVTLGILEKGACGRQCNSIRKKIKLKSNVSQTTHRKVEGFD